jgi:hypothetical protein
VVSKFGDNAVVLLLHDFPDMMSDDEYILISDVSIFIRFEVFMATKCNEAFKEDQQYQDGLNFKNFPTLSPVKSS